MWMGVDYGEGRVGIALYDESIPVAGPRALTTLRRRSRSQVIEQIASLASQHAVTRFIVGIPLAPDGGVGLRASQARNFARALSDRTSLPALLQDERDSTSEALERLIAAGVPMKKRGERIDEMAAVVILERFTRSHGPQDAEDSNEDEEAR